MTIKSVSAACLALAIAAVLSACSHPATRATPPATPRVSVIHPQRGEMTLSIELPGDLVGFYEAALHSKVTGYLKSIAVDKGDEVKRGEVLAEIQVPELHSNLQHAQAHLVIEKLTYERIKRVQTSDPRLVSQEDVDMAYAQYQQAQAAVHTLQTMVGYTKIIAPFDGRITGRFVDPGALVRAGGGDFGVNETSALISPGATEGAGGHRIGGGPILTIAKTNRLRVYVYVPARWCRYIRRGTPATLTVDGMPGLSIKSSVTRYAGALDLTTRTMLAEVDIDNSDQALYPRMYAHVKLDLVSHPQALRLPISAVSQGRQSATVLVASKGAVTTRSVSTGLVEPNYIEITSGLSTDDLVVDPFNADLRDGQTVSYTQPNPLAGPPNRLATSK
ncbi:MAG TPA: efflux RND transporter periplasmic adaptor subunit [Candidatus Binataceae bacterium]|nr:efflux RND transporter periplasmic adaptor subunit [Candidatus Binataceae bacterium]